MATLTSERAIQQFIEKARRLVDESAVVRPPVNPYVLAQLRGIRRVAVSRRLSVSGQLVRASDGLVIVLNATEPPERQNFSCCHEIAHTFSLDESVSRSRTADEVLGCLRYSFEEYLCDRSAAEMLMPQKFFEPLAVEREPSIAAITDLAKQFGTSVRATVVRLGDLATWPVVFVVWKFMTRLGSSRKLRVSWSVRPAGSRCFVPRHVPAHPDSGIYATFMASHSTLELESLDLGSLRGKYLVESARFGDYVLSIIHEPKLRGRVRDAR